MKDKELIIDPETASIVRRIYEEFIGGKAIISIARDLTAEGIRTLKGKPFENRTVDYILQNPVYKGYLRYTPGGIGSKRRYHDVDTKIFKGNHEPIIPPDMWDKAAERMADIKTAHRKYCSDMPKKYDLMLRGLLKCSTCGKTMIYSCHGFQCGEYNRGKCKVSHYISENRINAAVIDAIRVLNINGDINIVPPKTSKIEDNTALLIKREENKLKRIKDAYLNGIDTLEEYKTNKDKITAEIERLNSKVKPKSDVKPDLEKRRIEFIKLFDGNASPKELNAALKTFISHIVYDREQDAISIFLQP